LLPIVLRVILAAICGASSLVAQSAPARPQPEMPTPAGRIVDSIGFNTHWNATDSPYYRDFPRVSRLLFESGVRHARDGDDNPGYVGTTIGANYRTVMAHGITLSIFAPHAQPAAETFARIAQVVPNALFIEPDNEGDCSLGPSWTSTLRGWQPELYARVKRSARPNLLVLGPSLCNGLKNASALGDLSAYMDAGNAHWGATVDHESYPGSDDCCNQAALVRAMATVSGTKPLWISETAYDSNLSNGDGVPNDVAMKYAPRLVLINHQYRVPYTFFYELSDMPAEGAQFGQLGFVDASGNPKPQYNAIKSMTSLLADRGPAFTPDPLSWSLSGSTANVRHALLQRSDGSRWLLLWIEASGWNVGAKSRIVVPPQAVNVVLATAPSAVTKYTYNPDGTTTAARLQPSTSIPLTVTDSITFLRIR
jgi:hypothetical protein